MENTMDDERYAAGLKARQEVLGEEYVERSFANADALTKPLQDLVVEYGWGEIWTRPGLPRQTRSLLNIGLLTALNRPTELTLHIKGALTNGCSREEIVEVVLQTGIYCGLPAALDTMRRVKQVFDEVDS
jgi:4-carboxymuconolactone decarboxylase